jgi:hypothetical protein
MGTKLSTVDTIKARKMYNEVVLENATSGRDSPSFEEWAAVHYATNSSKKDTDNDGETEGKKDADD